MRPTILSLFAMLSLCHGAAGNDEYLLRVDTIGYLDSTEEVPKESVLHSIEVLARANETFHSKVSVGSETLIMSGKLHQQDGEFRVQFRSTHSVDTGTVIRGAPPVSNKTGVQTTVVVAAGKSIVIGDVTATRDETTDKSEIARVKSNKRFVLLLSEYQPPAE